MRHRNPPTVSLILTTYNWPEALAAVLDSVKLQDTLPTEVLIADDGSTDSTKQCIARYQADFPCPLIHIWHEDNGHRAAKIRNKAAAQASGEYLIFLDSDCLLRSDFTAQHLVLAKPKHFVAGNRVLLSKEFTQEILDQQIDVTNQRPFSFSRKQINRRWSLLNIPIGPFRHTRPGSWKGVKSCNMSMYKRDFIDANGFEENYQGWGYEDSDLAVRLQHAGHRRISGRFSTTVLHLWHSTNKSALEQVNRKRLQETIDGNRKKALQGIEQHEQV